MIEVDSAPKKSKRINVSPRVRNGEAEEGVKLCNTGASSAFKCVALENKIIPACPDSLRSNMVMRRPAFERASL